MIDKKDFKKIGVVVFASAPNEAVSLQLEDTTLLENSNEDFLMIEIDGGLVPFQYEVFRIKNKHSAKVFLPLLDTIEKAKYLIDCNVFLSKENHVSSTEVEPMSIRKLIGFSVTDKKFGFVGKVIRVFENQKNPLLAVNHGKAEVLIPFQDEIILEIDHEKKTIFCQAPDGLIEMYVEG